MNMTASDSLICPRISASMLELTLNTSPDAVRAATASLDAFERGSGHPRSGPEAQIYTHGRILIHRSFFDSFDFLQQLLGQDLTGAYARSVREAMR